MDYTTEISSPTNHIETITQAIAPRDSASSIQANLTPFDQQRDVIVGHMANDYNNLTARAVHNKEDVDSANVMKKYLKEAESKKSVIYSGIESAKGNLKTSKQNLSIELAKQKIVFELLGILSVTIVVYIVMGSSPYVHGVALFVLVFGILYVLNYNAYRLHAIGADLGSPSLSSLGNVFAPSGSPPSSSSSWNITSLFSAPNATGP